MDPRTVKAIQLKQMARMLLAKQGQLVESMLEEGLMTSDDAEEVIGLLFSGSYYFRYANFQVDHAAIFRDRR